MFWWDGEEFGTFEDALLQALADIEGQLGRIADELKEARDPTPGKALTRETE